MQLRVAFVGAHSTGKSTLLAECKKRFGDRLYPIENIARTLIARGLPMGDKATVQTLLEYVQVQLTTEQRAPKADLIVSDRTCIDSFAYAKANADFGLPSAVPEYMIKALRAIALRESDYYHLHVYFPIEFPIEFDPVRPGGGEEYRKVVDQHIATFLKANSICYHSSTGDVSNRAATLFRELAIQGVA
jgi:predicted ATPase